MAVRFGEFRLLLQSHYRKNLHVEGLYCKRPIQCLASSELLTPPPPGECVPRLWCGGRTHSLGGEGVGGQQFGRRQALLCTLHIYVSSSCGSTAFIESARKSFRRMLFSMEIICPCAQSTLSQRENLPYNAEKYYSTCFFLYYMKTVL